MSEFLDLKYLGHHLILMYDVVEGLENEFHDKLCQLELTSEERTNLWNNLSPIVHEQTIDLETFLKADLELGYYDDWDEPKLIRLVLKKEDCKHGHKFELSFHIKEFFDKLGNKNP